MSYKLKGYDLEYANKFLNRFGDVILNELMSHAQIILCDLKMGALHANNFDDYLKKQPDCAKFLLRLVVDNMAANLQDDPDPTQGGDDATTNAPDNV